MTATPPAEAPAPRLLVVDVTDAPRADPSFGDSLAELTGAVVAAGQEVGFTVRRVTADTPDAAALVAELDAADAVVITGGEDVDPLLYGGEEAYPHRGEIFGDADRAQAELVRAAVAADVPLVGICRGMQLVNVALGGSLVQHLDGHVRPGDPAESMVDHTVTIEAGSRIAEALGGTAFDVRSSHHQAVDRVGDGLVVVARDDADGIVEAVEHVSAPLWAVQWHPEDRGARGTVLTDLLVAARDAVVARARAV